MSTGSITPFRYWATPLSRTSVPRTGGFASLPFGRFAFVENQSAGSMHTRRGITPLVPVCRPENVTESRIGSCGRLRGMRLGPSARAHAGVTRLSTIGADHWSFSAAPDRAATQKSGVPARRIHCRISGPSRRGRCRGRPMWDPGHGRLDGWAIQSLQNICEDRARSARRPGLRPRIIVCRFASSISTFSCH
jgi:hypothetical protein